MDPQTLTQANWSDLSGLLRFVWLFSFSVITGALSLVLALAILPSLVASHHLPRELLRVRPVFLAGGFGALSLAVVMLTIVISRIDIIGDIYRRWMI